MIYLLASAWFGMLAARFAGLLFLVSPLAWFYGTVALTYIAEAFFSALLAYLCWRAWCGSGALVLPAAIVLGVAAGLRPSSLLILGPLLFFSLRRVSRRVAVMGIAALSLTLLAWSIPLVWQSGGPAGYIGPLWLLWRLVPSRATVFNSSPLTSLVRFCTILGIYGLCFGSAAFLHLIPRRSSVDRRITQFTWVWIAPSQPGSHGRPRRSSSRPSERTPWRACSPTRSTAATRTSRAGAWWAFPARRRFSRTRICRAGKRSRVCPSLAYKCGSCKRGPRRPKAEGMNHGNGKD